MSALAQEQCVSVNKTSTAATLAERNGFLKDLPGWSITAEGEFPTLTKAFAFADFKQALDFTNRIGEMAEQQDHHPRIVLEWGSVTVGWSTHKIKNLHRNDFIMAAKTDALLAPAS